MTSAPIRPPTMTMAKGRCESEPMPCDKAAGSRPRVATSMVIMMGRSRRTAPSMAASSMVCPRTRIWLMYSSMMTPVSTETPKRARKPTPVETLKLVCERSSATRPPMGAMETVSRISSAHFPDLNIMYRSEEGEEADAGGDAEVGMREEQRDQASDGRHGDGKQDQQRPLSGFEHHVQIGRGRGSRRRWRR